ncbi:5-methyltetrahydropteroyltriglutamate--homocysteine S-methyltransferase [Trueperella bialowiezensis]|uniref:5-methyltetrahydropteroyltriglutamate--homocysteine S-methyltransferase n=1 Tax=Trueperella bialowiezensis TaxID=312285 RepID=A0A3S4VGV5_9ACTO|nr:5-methyltetrahydropteroyltriglutamate--homocysteine S-methyltransferase [Trueperella bialowiezensis]VEI13782.1 5-methyltetrahydropteroyltriglutamate--homocysteine methyltransferase [Trueperella bialowiezensis]
MTKLTSTILGYPRIGVNRELKRALESYWAGKISKEEFLGATKQLRLANYERLTDLGLGEPGAIPDSHTYYDQVLDAAFLVGAIPQRFADLDGLDAYFAAARGDATHPANEMTKWFDTNYHYIVPEIDSHTEFAYTDTQIVDRYREAAQAGYQVRPVVVGPVTLLALAKGTDDEPDFDPLARLDDVLPAYEQLLAELAALGAPWVQFDEPALATDNLPASRKRLTELAGKVYTRFAEIADRPQILLAVPYGDSSQAFSTLVGTGVEAIGVDLDRGTLPEGATAQGITLAAGVVDGRNIWRTDLQEAADKLEAARQTGARVVASTTTSLQHVPHTLEGETWDEPLNSNLHSWLAFADEKVAEIVTLGRGLADGWDAISLEIAESTAALEQRAASAGVTVQHVRERTAALTDADRTRGDAAERQKVQREKLQLPVLPTTTIGSFPQRTELRVARAKRRSGELDEAGYREVLKNEITSVIELQEELGLDVLVHGEAERNDMVQYFAELLEGFAVTHNGWVQSYGSRCTRPSILWGDVERKQSLGGEWIQYAQSLTDKPVKGMLTGPVTIIAWSFPRRDIPLPEVADQLALALRDEIADLEAHGTPVIQVDEPALRELLPLDADKHADYLAWSVGAFRLATSGVQPQTQIHTHLCYSEFNQIIDAIAGLDADVTSVEAARSRMELLESVEGKFSNDIGPGVWDIHSPRVPATEELVDLIEAALENVPAAQLWVNPDCGLKTRDYDETVKSLRNLVAATAQVREKLEAARS